MTPKHAGDFGRRSILVFCLGASAISAALSIHGHLPTQASLGIARVSVPQEPAASSPASGEPAPQMVIQAAQRADWQERKFQALARFLSKKYRVSFDAMTEMVGNAYAAGREIGLDPLLILAVMAVESGFNPIAESVAGAQGLMQVIPKYHGEKFEAAGGEVLDPETNILVGAKILKEYVARSGSLPAALRLYSGGADSSQYAAKILGVKQRLHEVLRDYPRRRA